MLRLLCLALAVAAPAAPATESPAGRYRLAGGPDVASEIELLPNGRFRYFLAAGSLDERAEGSWTAEGRRVRMATEPKPVPPAFTAAASGRADEAAMTVKVSGPGGGGIAGIDVEVGFDGGEPVEGYTQEYGWSLPEGERRAPRWIELSLPIPGSAPQRFAVDLSQGNALAFTLAPNDLGVLDFADLIVEREGSDLLVHRAPAVLRYVRSR